MKPYPIFLVGLEKRHCIIIGGGHEAHFKTQGLLDVDAQVTVINETLCEPLQAMADAGKFTWLARAYQQGDLKDAFLVIAERSKTERNDAIFKEAEAERAIVNVMDDVKNCNFVAGSVIRQGPLTMSISTSGAAPAYSVRLRERLQQEFDETHGAYLTLLQQLRAPMAEVHFCFKQRRELWYALVDSDLLALMRAGDETAVITHLRNILGNDVVDRFTGDQPLANSRPPANYTVCDHQCKLPASITACSFEQAKLVS